MTPMSAQNSVGDFYHSGLRWVAGAPLILLGLGHAAKPGSLAAVLQAMGIDRPNWLVYAIPPAELVAGIWLMSGVFLFVAASAAVALGAGGIAGALLADAATAATAGWPPVWLPGVVVLAAAWTAANRMQFRARRRSRRYLTPVERAFRHEVGRRPAVSLSNRSFASPHHALSV